MQRRTPSTTLNQLSIRVPRELHHRLQQVALKRKQAGQTLSTQGEIVVAALAEWFERHDRKRGV